MQNEDQLDRALMTLGGARQQSLPGDFMEGVWMRAGQLEEIDANRRRLFLMAGMIFAGLGAGFGTSQAPAYAQPASYQLVDGADFSPAALLHVQS